MGARRRTSLTATEPVATRTRSPIPVPSTSKATSRPPPSSSTSRNAPLRDLSIRRVAHTVAGDGRAQHRRSFSISTSSAAGAIARQRRQHGPRREHQVRARRGRVRTIRSVTAPRSTRMAGPAGPGGARTARRSHAGGTAAGPVRIAIRSRGFSIRCISERTNVEVGVVAQVDPLDRGVRRRRERWRPARRPGSPPGAGSCRTRAAGAIRTGGAPPRRAAPAPGDDRCRPLRRGEYRRRLVAVAVAAARLAVSASASSAGTSSASTSRATPAQLGVRPCSSPHLPEPPAASAAVRTSASLPAR